MSSDLIYRMRRSLPYTVSADGFALAESLASALKLLPVMQSERGTVGAIKLLVKVGLRRCIYFYMADSEEIVSTGVLAFGRYRLHQVSRDAVVIGEIATRVRARGKGYATQAIMLAINSMVERGLSDFYIDTQPENVPMIRSIAKLGFGSPIAEHHRS